MSTGERGSASGAVVCAASAVAVLVLAAGRDFGADGYWVPVLAASLALCCLAPAFGRLLDGGRDRPIPFLPLFGVIYGVYYALPALVADRVGTMTAEVDAAGLERALALALGGLLALYAGHALAGRVGARSRPAELSFDPARAFSVATLLLPVGLLCHGAALLFELPGGLRQPVLLLANGLPVSLGVLFVLARRGHLPRATARLVFFAGVPLLLFSQVADAAIGQAVRTGIFFLALVWGTGGRVPVWLMVLGALGAAVLRGGAEEFRSLERHHAHLVSESPLERAGQFVGVSAALAFQDSGEGAFDTVLDRVSQVALLGHVMELTPEAVPYWGGATLATLPATFVPRALWPSKPTKELGQTFGHRYGILAADDETTSVNLPQLVELYANFGPLGTLIGMALVGAFYRWLSDRLNRTGAGDGGVVLAALLFSTLTNVESDLSLVLGSIAQVGLVFYGLLWLARGTARAAAGPDAAGRTGAREALSTT